MATSTINVLFEFDAILAEFHLKPHAMYAMCSLVIILVNLFLICFFLTTKALHKKGSNILLISLAVSDIAYEATTTPVFINCASGESRLSLEISSCQTLHAIYIVFNLSTAFHVLFEMLVKIFGDNLDRVHCTQRFPKLPGVCLSLTAWSSAFLLAYLFSWGDIVNENALLFYFARFKAFGQYIFAVALFSVFALISVALFLTKPGISVRDPELCLVNEENSEKADLMKSLSHTPARPVQVHLVFSCLFMSFTVCTFGWLLVGVTGPIMKTIEVMKCFEIIRLGSRVLNILTVFLGVMKSTDRSFQLTE